VDGLRVVAVDPLGRHPVALGARRGRRTAPAAARGELRVAVVLAHEDDGQRERDRQRDALVEGARVDRAVAEEGDGDGPRPLDAAREPGAHRERDAGADDAVRAEDAEPGVRDVHGPALAVAEPRGAPEELREHPRGIRALGDAVAVPAVRGRDPVARLERGTRAGGDRLLADGDVDEAVDVAVAEVTAHTLLERADARHRGEQPLDGGVLARHGDGL
jgi:hypothetical protein